MKNQDRSAGFDLLKTGTLVDFSILKTHIERTPGGGNLYVRAEMQFEADDQEEAAVIAEWGSFGFIFALAVLSFADARPRGFSSVEYLEEDEFGVDDFFKCLSFQRGELHFRAEYISGRSIEKRGQANFCSLIYIILIDFVNLGIILKRIRFFSLPD